MPYLVRRAEIRSEVAIFDDLVARIPSTQPYGCFQPTMATRAWGDLVPLLVCWLHQEDSRKTVWHPKVFTLPVLLGSMVK